MRCLRCGAEPTGWKRIVTVIRKYNQWAIFGVVDVIRVREDGGRERGIKPLGGIPSTSSLAQARAVWASWGRDVRIKEAERGRGRAADSWSSGMGAGWEGGGVVDIVVVGEGDEAGIATCVYQNMRQLVGTVVSP